MKHGTTTLPAESYLSAQNTDQFTLKKQGKISRIRAGWDDEDIPQYIEDRMWARIAEKRKQTQMTR